MGALIELVAMPIFFPMADIHNLAAEATISFAPTVSHRKSLSIPSKPTDATLEHVPVRMTTWLESATRARETATKWATHQPNRAPIRFTMVIPTTTPLIAEYNTLLSK